MAEHGGEGGYREGGQGGVSTKEGGQGGDTTREGARGEDAHVVLKRLSHALDTAVDATVHALKRSGADNRSLAEKLARLAKDIEGSRERVFKKRGEVEVLMTELEMLGVLLRRCGHGHEVGADEGVGGGGSNMGGGAGYTEEARNEGGGGGDVVGCGSVSAHNGGVSAVRKVRREKKERIVVTRTESYESPSVVDEGEEDEGGDEGSGVQVMGHGEGENGHVGNGERMEGEMVEVVEVRETS